MKNSPTFLFLAAVLGLLLAVVPLNAQSATLRVTPTADGASVQVTVRFPEPVMGAGGTCTLPDGWSYVGGSAEPTVRPEPGQTGVLEWASLEMCEVLEFRFEVVRGPAARRGETIKLTGFWVRENQILSIETKPTNL